MYADFKWLIPWVLAFICMGMYSYIITELKPLTNQYNVIVLAVCYLPIQLGIMFGTLGVAAGINHAAGVPLVFPSGWTQWGTIAFFALAYAVAQTLNAGVYATGGNAMMVSYMTLCIPLMVGVLNWFLHGAPLNKWHYIAFALFLPLALAVFKANNEQAAVMKAAKASALAVSN